MLCMLRHVFEDSQITACMKNLDTSYSYLLKTLLQMNSNISVTKQTNKQTEICTLRLSFKTQLKD